MGESSSTNAASSETAPSGADAPPADSQLPSEADPATDGPDPDEPAPPLNRAARRGKPNANDSAHGQERGFGHRARAAQGRRFNPIRRTG